MERSPKASLNARMASGPVQCVGPTRPTPRSLNAATMLATSAAGVCSRWNPPTTVWIGRCVGRLDLPQHRHDSRVRASRAGGRLARFADGAAPRRSERREIKLELVEGFEADDFVAGMSRARLPTGDDESEDFDNARNRIVSQLADARGRRWTISSPVSPRATGDDPQPSRARGKPAAVVMREHHRALQPARSGRGRLRSARPVGRCAAHVGPSPPCAKAHAHRGSVRLDGTPSRARRRARPPCSP